MSVRANQKFTSDLFIASRHAEVTEKKNKRKKYGLSDIGSKYQISTKHKMQMN